MSSDFPAHDDFVEKYATAPNLKYTDRDVRENDGLEDMAYRYLESYQGEFQFLVDAKMNANLNGELSVGVLRGVLNCMRVDPRVPKMPEPLPYDPGKVLPMSRPARRRKRQETRHCDIEDFHERHSGDGYYYCDGKYPINRQYLGYQMPATVKPYIQFAKARTGTMLHLVESVHIMWYPNQHTWGWKRDPALIVKTACRYPSSIVEGKLLTDKKAAVALSENMVEVCRHCLPDGVNLQ